MNIIIRQYQTSDAKKFQQAVLDSYEHLSLWMDWCKADYSIEDAREWASSAKSTWEDGSDYRFLIENPNTQDILGSVGINQVNTQHNTGNLGYWVSSNSINQGVCTKAARLAAQYAFEQLGFTRLEIHILVDNLPSQAVALKLKAQYEGTFRNKLVFHGEPMAAKCYSLIPSDLEQD